MEPEVSIDEPEPVIALAQTEPVATSSYDRQELAQVLTEVKLKDLPTHPVFVTTCKAAYQKRQFYMGVAKEFRGASSGSRETAIKAALGHAEVGRSELQPAA
jgi:hypothetical protein